MFVLPEKSSFFVTLQDEKKIVEKEKAKQERLFFHAEYVSHFSRLLYVRNVCSHDLSVSTMVDMKRRLIYQDSLVWLAKDALAEVMMLMLSYNSCNLFVEKKEFIF